MPLDEKMLMAALNTIAEGQVRLEHKLDQLMLGVGMGTGTLPQLGFVGQQCPVCRRMVEYQVDIQAQVVKRVCGCKTGKQPVVIPLTPVEEKPSVRAPDAAGGSEPEPPPAEDRSRRQGR